MRRRHARLGSVAAVCATLVSCSDSIAPPRRQLLVVVDTNAPVLEQALADPDIAAEATVDVVRIDVLDQQGDSRLVREISGTSTSDWPVSFAVVPPEHGAAPVARLRVRAFRARDATPGEEGGVSTLDPVPSLAIDRIVEVPPPPDETVQRVLVRLDGGCFGVPPSFLTQTSCVDAEHHEMPFGTPLPAADVGYSTIAGTWSLARAIPCATTPAEGRVCIPGGVSVLGSTLTAGMEDGFVAVSSLPQRVIHVSPFHMDVTELTVTRARRWLSRLDKRPYARGAAEVVFSDYCTLSDDAPGDLPLNCVSEETAARLCALEGGRLPTEAEWNHAATGRGQGRRFPWGDVHGGCCNMSGDRRVRGFPDSPRCSGEGVEPVRSHLPERCRGLGDVSRDGVYDLGGSVSEILRGRPRALDDACWGPPFGILFDPVCAEHSPTSDVATRGGNWSDGLLTGFASLRREDAVGIGRGFRCVYEDRP